MKNIIIILAALALTACSSMKTNSDFDPSVSFDNYKTYAWVKQKNTGEKYHLDGLMDQRVRSAIDAEMAAKGMKKVDADSADLLVNYLTKVDKKINVDTFNNNFGYYPYHRGGWAYGGSMHTQTTVREYKVGTLIVDLVDKEKGALVWRGTVADTIRDHKTPEKRVEVVNKAINQVMANFPPQAE
ncbi:DUF4136 domain-containing protein [Shewanella maritima]|uniref:DUF4136 domain-containing protein n=1 Tax=Shewanella maritima TaxID=2520507 RepID=UPI0037364AF5